MQKILLCTFSLIINYLLASDHYEQPLQANTHLGAHFLCVSFELILISLSSWYTKFNKTVVK